MADLFAGDRYTIRQQFFSFPHRKFRVYDEAGTLVLYCQMRGFRLKEDIRLYPDETMNREMVSVQARQIIDFSAAYDVLDMTTGRRLGVLRRRGFTSMIRDSWEVLSPEELPMGNIVEDSMLKALVRRFVDFAAMFMPQAFHVDIDGQRAATFKQNFNPFVRTLDVTFEPDTNFDRRYGLAAGVVMMAIEGRQE